MTADLLGRFLPVAGIGILSLALGCSDDGFTSKDSGPGGDASADRSVGHDFGDSGLKLKDQDTRDKAPLDQETPDQQVVDQLAPDQQAADQLTPDQLVIDQTVAVDLGAGLPVKLKTGGNTTTRGSATGGTAYNETCPSGQALMGFYGQIRSGSQYHGKMGARCGKVDLVSGPSVKITAGMTYALHGKYGSSTTWTRDCPSNQVIVGFRGRGGGLVDQLTFRCASLKVASGRAGYTVTMGATTDLAAIGGTGGSAFAQTDCPSGQVANTSRIRAGDGIDGFGLGCATPSF